MDSGKYRIAILDDEKSYCEEIAGLIREYTSSRPALNVEVELFDNSFEFEGIIEKQSYDLYILDIFMDGVTGIEVAKLIREKDKKCDIIFMTTSDGFYKEAYELQAVQYIEKPPDKDRLFACFDRIFKDDMVFFNIMDGKKLVRIPLNEII